jgi:hypothetical protein
MGRVAMNVPAPTLCVFTSAPQDRPQYIRDFLTCLASPNGHRQTFSYERKWIADEVLDWADRGEKRKALVVFCEPDGDDFRFLPLRWVEVIDLGPEEIVRRRLAVESTHLSVRFRLDQFVAAEPGTAQTLADQVTEHVRLWEQRPFPRPQGNPKSTWLRFGDVSVTSAAGDQETAWLSHAELLSGCPTLDSSTIFRVSRPQTHRLIGGTKEVAIKDHTLLGDTYPFRDRRQYRLDVSFFLREGADPKDLVTATVSSEAVGHTQPITVGMGRVARATIFFAAKSLAGEEIATVAVEGIETDVLKYSPRVAFVGRFRPRYPLILLGLLIIAIGVFVASLSSDDWARLTKHLAFHWIVLIKAAGAALVILGTFIAFRRSPGGGA